MIIRDEKLVNEAMEIVQSLSDKVVDKIYMKATKDAKALKKDADVDDVVVVAQSILINFIYYLIFKFCMIAEKLDQFGGKNEE